MSKKKDDVRVIHDYEAKILWEYVPHPENFKRWWKTLPTIEEYQNKNYCRYCDNEVRYISEPGAWWCDNCNKWMPGCTTCKYQPTESPRICNYEAICDWEHGGFDKYDSCLGNMFYFNCVNCEKCEMKEECREQGYGMGGD